MAILLDTPDSPGGAIRGISNNKLNQGGVGWKFLVFFLWLWLRNSNRPLLEPLPVTLSIMPACNPIDSFHRCGRLWWLFANQQGSYNCCARCYMFLEHQTQYLSIYAPFTRIVVIWHIGNKLPMVSLSQICWYTATFCITAIFVKYCYTTDSGLL